MFFALSCNCLCPIHWSQKLSREWRCSWIIADRRCSNYIWMINNLLPTMMRLILRVDGTLFSLALCNLSSIALTWEYPVMLHCTMIVYDHNLTKCMVKIDWYWRIWHNFFNVNHMKGTCREIIQFTWEPFSHQCEPSVLVLAQHNLNASSGWLEYHQECSCYVEQSFKLGVIFRNILAHNVHNRTKRR